MTLHFSEGDKQVNLLTIVEQIEPDMPDYIFSPKELVAFHEGLLGIDVEDYDAFGDWQDDLKNVCERIADRSCQDYQREPQGEHHYVLAREFDESKLTEILPFRKGPYYVVSYQQPNCPARELLQNEELKQQITAVTVKHLGYDLCGYDKWIGGIYMVWHHPFIKDIQFIGTDNPAGMLCSVITRKPVGVPLTFIVTDFDKEGNPIGKPVEKKVNTATVRFLLNMPQPVTRPNVDIIDESGELVFSIKGIIFIKKIVLNMGIIDGVTGKRDAMVERDVISADIKVDKDSAERKREELTRQLLLQLRSFPQEEAELIIEEVKRRLGGK